MNLIWCAWWTSAGKDEFINGVLLPLGFTARKTSDMLRWAIPAFFGTDFSWDVKSLSPVELNEYGGKIREVHGQDIFTMLAIHEDTGNENRVINWVRRAEEFSAIHKYGGRVILIMCDVDTAVKRVIERKRLIDQRVDEEAIRAHIIREQDTLHRARNWADAILTNNFWTVDEFIDYAGRVLVKKGIIKSI